jgi:hypothetical protein
VLKVFGNSSPWRDLRECSDTELVVHRTNLSRFPESEMVRARLAEIQREIDRRGEGIGSNSAEAAVHGGPVNTCAPGYPRE